MTAELADLLQKTLRASLEQTDAVIQENLRDPDMAGQSADYKDGYARGFREASLAFITYRLDRLAVERPAPPPRGPSA